MGLVQGQLGVDSEWIGIKRSTLFLGLHPHSVTVMKPEFLIRADLLLFHEAMDC